MSYQTNPILNRIKLSKGWKTSTFPTNSLNYYRDTALWFKVYLFLKVFLLLHGIRLLTCEVRISDLHTKILYLSITKQSISVKKSKSKWKSNSFLQKLKSPLTTLSHKKARFLLYLDLQKLKKNSFLFFTPNQKQVLSRVWIAKPRLYAWLNNTHLIFRWRKRIKLKLQLAWKKKILLISKNIRLAMKKNKNFVFKRPNHKSQNVKSFSLQTKTNFLFWKKKQRNLLSLFTKMQKNLFVLEKHYAFLWSHSSFSKKVSIPRLTNFVGYKIQQKKLFLKKIRDLYYHFHEKKFSFQRKQFSPKRFSKNRFLKKKKQNYHQIFLLNFIKELCFSRRNQFFLSTLTKRTIFGKKKLLINQIYNPEFQKKIQIIDNFLKKKLPNGNPLLNVIIAKNIKNSILLKFLLKTRFFQKYQQITRAKIFLWKRISQQRKLFSKKNKNKHLVNLQHYNSKAQRRSEKTRSCKQRPLFYRTLSRINYKNFLNISTKVKLKYLLQDLLHKYFNVVLNVKVSWPLSQFKNLQFYRLLFPKYKFRVQEKEMVSLKISQNNVFLRKRYFYIGKNTKHLKCVWANNYASKMNAKNFSLYEQKNFFSAYSTNSSSYKILNLWQKKGKKKNKYFLLKNKVLKSKSEKRLAWPSRASFISKLITTLTLFVKYLDPQPVVDQIAEIIGGTKKHIATLKLIETVLRTFHLKRGLGYRMALVGRINGANKSRTIYLRKLNRNRSRQNFSKNVNYALAHARATIGTFAIKLWVYY